MAMMHANHQVICYYVIISSASISENRNFNYFVMMKCAMTVFHHYTALQPRQPEQPWNQIPWTPVPLLPTELWLEWFSGSAKYWTNALCCKAQSTTQSTELIPLYLVAGHAFNWLLCVVRTRLWDWITWHQQPQRQPLYNDHADSLQEHDTVAFSATHKRGRKAVVNNSNYFTLFQVNTSSNTM